MQTDSESRENKIHDPQQSVREGPSNRKVMPSLPKCGGPYLWFKATKFQNSMKKIAIDVIID